MKSGEGYIPTKHWLKIKQGDRVYNVFTGNTYTVISVKAESSGGKIWVLNDGTRTIELKEDKIKYWKQYGTERR